MKNIVRVSVLALGFLLFTNALFAREEPVLHPKSGPALKDAAAGCSPGSAYKYLDIITSEHWSIHTVTAGSLNMPNMKSRKDPKRHPCSHSPSGSGVST